MSSTDGTRERLPAARAKTDVIAEMSIGVDSSLRAAAACIERSIHAIALVTHPDGRLIGTITDGDIRRAVLAGLSLETTVADLLERKSASPYPAPVTAPVGTDRSALLRLMSERVVRQIPLLDDQGRVVGVFSAVQPGVPGISPHAVVMAGGEGQRLRPLTLDTPKPMLPIGDRPLLELIIAQLKGAGIRDISITTHYLPEKIEEHFGDGSRFDVNIRYIPEDQPLGTAGALAYVDEATGPILVVNGDILTGIDFGSMVAFHREHEAALTVGIRRYELQVPYGVVECEGERVLGIVEKPTHHWFVSAGIYLLEPRVIRMWPAGGRYDMTDVIARLIERGEKVCPFPITEYWIDIGQPLDYERAIRDLSNGMLPT